MKMHIVIIAACAGAFAIAQTELLSAESAQSKSKGAVTSPGSTRMLNPQPLPPKQKASGEKGIIIVGGKHGKGQPGATRKLNPQPLPPKEKRLTKKGIR